MSENHCRGNINEVLRNRMRFGWLNWCLSVNTNGHVVGIKRSDECYVQGNKLFCYQYGSALSSYHMTYAYMDGYALPKRLLK